MNQLRLARRLCARRNRRRRQPLFQDRNGLQSEMTQLRPSEAVERSPTCQRSAPRLSDPVCGVLTGAMRVSFRETVSISKSSTSKRHLTTAVVVLTLAIVGSLGAILLRTSAAARADSIVVELKRSLP